MAASNLYAIIAGVGPGTGPLIAPSPSLLFKPSDKHPGRSIALKFAAAYPTVFLLARSADSYDPIVSEIKASGRNAVGISTDVASPSSVSSAFKTIAAQTTDKNLAAAIFNVGGKFVRKPFLELTEEEYASGFEANGRGLFNFAQGALPLLLNTAALSPAALNPPSLLLTGATASIRGSALCSSFASGKFALRATAQSLAKEFGPKGVHVAHAIIDGAIDGPRFRGMEIKVNTGSDDSIIQPDAIADAFWWLHAQPRSAWTHEIDIRPFDEKF
jgi:NAD(P)-dependent dehydrogenase (short-subunit alcohol dehydrogenase family)